MTGRSVPDGLSSQATEPQASPPSRASIPSAAFTPGPWVLEPWGNYDKEIIVRQDADSWHRLHAAIDSDDCDRETAIANAHLIAAAPDLLEALDALWRQAAQSPDLIHTQRGQDALTGAVNALAKARGETA